MASRVIISNLSSTAEGSIPDTEMNESAAFQYSDWELEGNHWHCCGINIINFNTTKKGVLTNKQVTLGKTI